MGEDQEQPLCLCASHQSLLAVCLGVCQCVCAKHDHRDSWVCARRLLLCACGLRGGALAGALLSAWATLLFCNMLGTVMHTTHCNTGPACATSVLLFQYRTSTVADLVQLPASWPTDVLHALVQVCGPYTNAVHTGLCMFSCGNPWPTCKKAHRHFRSADVKLIKLCCLAADMPGTSFSGMPLFLC